MRILVFSDIHNDTAALSKLMEREADLYFAAGDLVNWAKGFEKVGPILQQRADRVYVIPGNHESEADIARFCATYRLHDFQGQIMQVGAYTLAGLGYSNPTPFNTPGEMSEQELASRLAAFTGLPRLVAICHCPPLGSALDRSGTQHFGSTAVREFIEREQPEYFFCGHIHEAGGVTDRIGRTQAVNVGKKGYLLELGA